MDKNNLTKYERARIIGARALQISMGAPIMVQIPVAEMRFNPVEIAKKELEADVLPITVRRLMKQIQ